MLATYVNTNEFSVAGDKTAEFLPAEELKLTVV
jgi:hypothetical protein